MVDGFDGLDVARPIVPAMARKLKADGFDFLGRYYGQNREKILHPAEAHAIASAGLYIVSVYEDSPTKASYFSHARGEADAHRAVAQAISCKQPEATPIFAAVDYDAQKDHLPMIAAYFAAWRCILLGAGYKSGAYASGLVLRRLIDSGLVSHSWLAQSTGWASYEKFKASNDWNIVQGPERSIHDLDVDLDRASGKGDGWMPLAPESQQP